MRIIRSTYFRPTLMVVMSLLLCTCEHRELMEINNRHYIRIYLDEHLRNVTYGFYDESKQKPEYKTPRGIHVMLCDPQNGNVMGERYLQSGGSDERGNYVHGTIVAKPGVYNLLAYNYDTEATHIKNKGSYYGMEVYTNPINESLRNRLQSVRSNENTRVGEVRYEPDHVFVTTVEGIHIDDNPDMDTLYTVENTHPTAQSVTLTYYIQVNVKGVEYVRSASALITGMSGSVRIHNRSLVPEMESSIYFNLQNGLSKERNSQQTAVAYASFNTFGKLPNTEGYIEITFEFNTTDGKVQTETFKVTDLFETPDVKERQWIIIDKTIEIIPPEGSTGNGMSPDVTQWEQIEGSFTI